MTLRIVAALCLAAAFDWLTRVVGVTVPWLALVSLQQRAGAHSYHGEPVVSTLGVCFVLFMLAMQAGAVVVALADRPSPAYRRCLKASVAVFIASVAFVLTVDPRFLPTVLPRSLWNSYRATLALTMPAVLPLYEGWAYARWFAWLAFAHASLLVAVAIVMLRFGSRDHVAPPGDRLANIAGNHDVGTAG